MQFAEDALGSGIAVPSAKDMRTYLEFITDQRLGMLSLPKVFGSKSPFPLMDLQDNQELANFFERRVSAYQVGINGKSALMKVFN